MEDGTEALLFLQCAMERGEFDSCACAKTVSAICSYQEGLAAELRRLVPPGRKLPNLCG